jgi:RNA recognition motif-containing protein
MDSLLFANIPHNCADDELRTWIEDHGFKVNGLKLIRDAVTGTSPAFARVQLHKPAADAAAVALDQKSFGGRRLHVRRGRSPLDD